MDNEILGILGGNKIIVGIVALLAGSFFLREKIASFLTKGAGKALNEAKDKDGKLREDAASANASSDAAKASADEANKQSNSLPDDEDWNKRRGN